MSKTRHYSALRRDRIFFILFLMLSCLLLSSCNAADGGPAGPAARAESTADSGSSADSSVDTEYARDAGTVRQDDSESSPSDGKSSIDLSEKAAAVSGKNGVQILYGDNVPLTYKDYTAAPLKDKEKIASALEELDRILSIYPPEFFSSVKEGYCESINICLAQDLHAINDDSHIESAYAFTTVQNDRIWLVLNADRPLEQGLLIHELTHVIDYRLLGMQQLREAEWNQLNPPSFSYYNAYLDENGVDLRISGSNEYTAAAEEEIDRIWFYDAYSKTFAMEDRARLMEKLLENAVLASGQEDASSDAAGTDRAFSSKHIQTKLRFYFYTLRQAFENALWPEETVWEAELHKATQ